MDFYKVASADLTNHQLLEKLIATVKQINLFDEQTDKIEQLFGKPDPTICQAFSVILPINTIQGCQSRLKTKRNNRRVSFNYSGHERGVHHPLYQCWGKIIEKHFTINKEMEGNDHGSRYYQVSSKLVEQCRI